jgi:uncharacterized membrane protein YidH (DUF202 family)
MSIFSIVILIVGFIFLILGILSGINLFKHSQEQKNIDNSNIFTMWGLFLSGTTIGLLLIWFGLP